MVKEKEIPEVVGLDDEDIADTLDEPTKEAEEKVSGKKKLILPIAGAVIIFILSITVAGFLSKFNTDESKYAETDNVDSEADSKNEIPEAVKEFKGEKSSASFDTLGAMEEMEFLEFASEWEEQNLYLSDDYTDYSDIDLSYLEITPEDVRRDKAKKEKEMGNKAAQDSLENINWLDTEKAKLAGEKKEIKKLKDETEKRIKELELLEKRVGSALAKVNKLESERTTQLARLYDSMDPESVATLFAKLSDKVILAILPRIKPANAAKVMSLMPPERAARISTKMMTVLDKK